MYEKLKQKALELGVDIFGVADLTKFKFKNSPTIPEDLCNGFTKAVSVAIALPKTIFQKIKAQPTPEYAKYYNTVNERLDYISFNLAREIESLGYSSLPIPASQKIDTPTSFSGAITHKAIARLAGIGWQGKSLLIVSPEFGPRIRLATILTDAPLKYDKPIESQCGNCEECKKACPTGAIKGIAPKNEFYESRDEALYFEKCFNKLVNEFANLPSIGYPICGVCIKVCPYLK